MHLVKKKKLLAVISLLLALVLPLIACTTYLSFNELKNPFARPENPADKKIPLSPHGTDQLSAENLVQTLVLAINGSYPTEDIYNSLPSHIKADVTNETFRRYIVALRPNSGEKISSFLELSQENREKYLDEVLSAKPALANLALNSKYFILYCDESKNTTGIEGMNFVILAIQHDEEGQPYFDCEWLEAINALYEFSYFYFAAIQDEALFDRDYGALAYILEQGPSPFAKGDIEKYSQRKAKAIADYYDVSVRTNPLDSTNVLLLPGVAHFVQEVRYSGRLSGVREVSFYEQNGVFRVEEKMPNELGAGESLFLLYDQLILSGGDGSRQSFSNGDVHPLVGPLLSLEQNVHELTGSISYILEYPGLRLKIKGFANLETKIWQGVIEEVCFSSPVFSVGEQIYVGMTEESFHNLYPFYIDNEKEFSTSGLFRNFVLEYEAKDGILTEITFSRKSG